MKKIFIKIFALMACSAIMIKADSLDLAFHNLDDESKINKFNELSESVVDYSIQDAFNYANAALKLSRKHNDKIGIINSEINLGIIYKMLMNYDDAFESFDLALSLSKSQGYKTGMRKSTFNIALLYYKLSSFENALNYLRSLDTVSGDPIYSVESEILTAQIYIKKNMLGRATYYIYMLESLQENVNISLKIRIKTLLGEYQKALGHLDSAITYFNSAVLLCKSANNLNECISPLIGLGECYSGKQDFQTGLGYINEALDNSRKLSNFEKTTESFMALSNLYTARKDFSKALEIRSRYNSLKDSLLNVSFLKSVEQSRIMQTNIENLRRENEFKNTITYLLLVIIALIIVMGFGILNRLLYTRKANREIIEAYQKLKISEEDLAKSNLEKQEYLSIIEADLKQASQYVLSILPKQINEPLLSIDWLLVPSLNLGGDGFGYHWIDSNNFAIYFLDVTGHGVGASLHAISVLNIIKNEALPGADFSSPEKVIFHLRKTFLMSNYNDLLFTIWYGVYNKAESKLSFASAGHHPALLFKNEKESEELYTGNPIIGMPVDCAIEQGEVMVQPGSTLLLFSDGVFEIFVNGEIWGYEKFVQHLKSNELDHNLDLESIFNYVKQIKGSENLDDDFSILKIIFE